MLRAHIVDYHTSPSSATLMSVLDPSPREMDSCIIRMGHYMWVGMREGSHMTTNHLHMHWEGALHSEEIYPGLSPT